MVAIAVNQRVQVRGHVIDAGRKSWSLLLPRMARLVDDHEAHLVHHIDHVAATRALGGRD